jgi:hypothetical protein
MAAALQVVHCTAGVRERGAENAIHLTQRRKEAKDAKGRVEGSWCEFPDASYQIEKIQDFRFEIIRLAAAPALAVVAVG